MTQINIKEMVYSIGLLPRWNKGNGCTNHMRRERHSLLSTKPHDSSENIVPSNYEKHQVLWLRRIVILNDNLVSNVLSGTFLELQFAISCHYIVKWDTIVSSWMRWCITISRKRGFYCILRVVCSMSSIWLIIAQQIKVGTSKIGLSNI